MVLVSRGMSVFGAALWSITTRRHTHHQFPPNTRHQSPPHRAPIHTRVVHTWRSLPQPVMALASFMAVDSFALVQRAGLGFAAGAMLYVACAEVRARPSRSMRYVASEATTTTTTTTAITKGCCVHVAALRRCARDRWPHLHSEHGAGERLLYVGMP